MKIYSTNQNLNRDNTLNRKNDRILKAGVITTTAAGVGTAFACIAKKQGFSLNPSIIKKTPIKNWAIFKLYNKKNPNARDISLKGKEILILAFGSVAGGLVGGALFDNKKHLKSKFKESVNQLLGNVSVPIACVWGASEIYKKNKADILKYVPHINGKGKLPKLLNGVMKAVPGSIITLAALGTGIIAGNKVSNLINEKVFHKKVQRGIKKTDFAPHVDDIGVAVTLMAEKSLVSSLIQRSVPLFLCVPGIQVGMHRDKR